MIPLRKILSGIEKYAGEVGHNKTIIKIHVNPAKLRAEGIDLLYYLLNHYEEDHFITIKNLPFCLMPDAMEHMAYSRTCHSHEIFCQKCDFKNICRGSKGFLLCEKGGIKPLKEIPHEVVLEITTRCNFDCKICARVKEGQAEDVDFTRAKKIIDESRSLGIRAIRFTGGEPLLNRDIAKMLLYAKKNKFYVLLNTNGTIIKDSILKVLRKSTDNVLVSLQGYNRATDSVFTHSPVNFYKKLENILKIKSNVPLLRIGTVISQTLLHHFDQYYKIVKHLGIKDWDFYRPMSKNPPEEFTISKNDIVKVMKFARTLKKKGMKVKIANPVPFCITKDIPLSLTTLEGANADDGHSRIVFDPRGFFKPSYFIDVNLGKSIRQAWENPFVKKIRALDYLPYECQQCGYLKWCKGGSRSISKIFKNNYFVKDPLSARSPH